MNKRQQNQIKKANKHLMNHLEIKSGKEKHQRNTHTHAHKIQNSRKEINDKEIEKEYESQRMKRERANMRYQVDENHIKFNFPN